MIHAPTDTDVPRRIALIADELRGFSPVGGLGTATSFLAVALARIGHHVEILYCGEHPIAEIEPSWSSFYAQAEVTLRDVEFVDASVEPWHFARIQHVEPALRHASPDVVVVQDLGAPAYIPLRLRHLGLGFEDTLFVVFCHGTRRWVTDMSSKLRVKNVSDLLGSSVLEQASLELADVVVSPSEYLVSWMCNQGWRLPGTTFVIPYLTRSGATGEVPPEPVRTGANERVQRLVFFGRLEEKKGLKPFASALNALEPPLLQGLELEFMGKSTPSWRPDRVESLLSERTRGSLRKIVFETDLDQPEALARLSRPGTLAVMPSTGDNSPNTVYECLERGIPFVASTAGGIAELVNPADHGRALAEPTGAALEKVLRRVLTGSEPLRAARPTFDAATSLRRWADVVAMQPQKRRRPHGHSSVDIVVVHSRSREALAQCLAAIERQGHPPTEVTVVLAGEEVGDPGASVGAANVVRSQQASIEAARHAGLEAGRSPWVVFLDEDDVIDPELLATLVRAQAESDADVVTCGVYVADDGAPSAIRLFAGEPAGLGVLANAYGNTGLLRRSLLADVRTEWPTQTDPDWPLLAALSMSGARIVSIPMPLVTRARRPGTIEQDPSDALLVVERLEQALPDPLASVGRIAAGLAANRQISAAADASPTAKGRSVFSKERLATIVGSFRHRLGRRR